MEILSGGVIWSGNSGVVQRLDQSGMHQGEEFTVGASTQDQAESDSQNTGGK